MIWHNPLASSSALLLDGGTGSELRRRGVSLNRRAWSALANLEHRDVIVAIHRDYIGAGANVVTANTFAGARFVLACAGLEDRWLEVNVAAVTAALEARDASGRDVAVAASLSCLPPDFDIAAYPDPAAELAAYRELVALFAELGVDLVLLEMMQETRHAALACAAVEESGLPWWLGISCRLAGTHRQSGLSGDDRVQEDGVAQHDAAAQSDAAGRIDSERTTLTAFDLPDQELDATLDALLPFEPEVVAVMHSPLDAMVPALQHLRARWTGALGAYAEIGYPEDPGANATERLSPEDYAREARRWLDCGARVIGGCCGTTPEHIRALAALVHRNDSGESSGNDAAARASRPTHSGE